VKLKKTASLYLDIWVPPNATSASGLPVKVWIYGGGKESGGISDPLYNECNLAKVVSINYKLGPLGFLALESAGIAEICISRIFYLGFVSVKTGSCEGRPRRHFHGDAPIERDVRRRNRTQVITRRSKRATRIVARDIPAMAPPDRAGVGDTNVEFLDGVRVGIELVVVVAVVVVNTVCACRRILLADIDGAPLQLEGASVRVVEELFTRMLNDPGAHDDTHKRVGTTGSV
jgi:hypothetical protein